MAGSLLIGIAMGRGTRHPATSSESEPALPVAPGLEAECEPWIRRAHLAEARLAAARRDQDVEAAAEADAAAQFHEDSLLGRSKSWDQVDPAFRPDAIQKQIEELETYCGGDVGLIDLDCEEYPCISWSKPSETACAPRGTLMGGMNMDLHGSPNMIDFAVHASKDGVHEVRTRVDWRLSRRMQDYRPGDPEDEPME
jgi:hypothetical protein